MLLNPALRDFWTVKARNRVLYGGRASSKSHDAAGMAIYLARNYRVKFLCTRQFQNRIEDSVYTLLKSKIEDFGMGSDFEVLKSSIVCPETGSEFIFYGRARNIEEIKGTEGVDIHWAEECELLTAEEWRVIDPTIRKDGSQHWIIFNPQFATDFVYQHFVVDPPTGSIVRQINYPENPFLSQTMLDLIEEVKARDPEEYEHVYLGVPLSDGDRVVIQRKWIEAAIDAHIKLGFEGSGRKVLGYDIADDGADKCATVFAHGSIIRWGEEWKGGEDELLKSCTRAYSSYLELGADMLVYDCIGVGASAGAKFNELNEGKRVKVRHKGFNAGGEVFAPKREYAHGKTNEDQFSNIKAQAWWMLADRFRNTYDAITTGRKYPVDQMISIDSSFPQIKKLITELSTPKRDFDNNGRVKVESKKDLAKREVKSPNCFIAGTMVSTPCGEVDISAIKIGDEIITPMGTSKVIALHESTVDLGEITTSHGLTGTKDHKVFTWNRGWAELQTLKLCDTVENIHSKRFSWAIMNALYTKAKCSQFSTQVDTIVQDVMGKRNLTLADFYIEGYGKNIVGRFLMGMKYITSMATGGTMLSKILNALKRYPITESTCLSVLKIKNTEKKTGCNLLLLGEKQANGTNQKKEENGTKVMHQGLLQTESIKNMFAKYVEKLLCHVIAKSLKRAVKNALQRTPTKKPLSNTHQFVRYAVQSSSTQRSDQGRSEGVQKNVPTQCKSVKVYNITLDEHNVYYANGILVKNCADACVMCFAPMSAPLRISQDALTNAMRR